MTETILNECKNCGHSFEGKYCNHCGQKANVKRFMLRNLHDEFIHGFFHVHHGILFTIKELFIRPGISIRGYISGKRVTYFNPFTYLVLLSILAGFGFSHSGMLEHTRDNFMASGETLQFTRKHFSYRLLLSIPAYTLMTWTLFRSFKYNFAEHFVVNTFLISQTTLIYCIWMVVLTIFSPDHRNFQILLSIAHISTIIYLTISIFSLFNTGKLIWRWVKSTIAVLGGLVISTFIMNSLVTYFHAS
jgi:hypothetical protein